MRFFLFFLTGIAFAGETIYGVMLTGKDAIRERFATLAVENFFAQTYPDKKLIIYNHSPTYSLGHLDPRIIEIRGKKEVLGRMRNKALARVPKNGLFATWDDDDWRWEGMLAAQHKKLTEARADCCALRNRIEYIFKNDYAFYLKRPQMSALILCRKKGDAAYAETGTGEDWRFLDAYAAKHRLVTIDNPPHWYLRFQHGDNVTYPKWAKKRLLEPGQWHISEKEKLYLKEALTRYQWVYASAR